MKTLSLESLIGTNLLRAYMHGYFIDNRLYQKAKSAANPFAHEEFVAKQIEKDIDEEAKRKPIKKKVNLYRLYGMPSLDRNMPPVSYAAGYVGRKKLQKWQ